MIPQFVRELPEAFRYFDLPRNVYRVVRT